MVSEKTTAQNLAQQRTVWANERTRLANERTFATWIRTGLAVLGVGFGIGKLLALEPQWVIRGLAVAFMLVAGLIFVVAFHTYRHYVAQLREEGVSPTAAWTMTLLEAVLLLGTLAGLAFLFVE